MAQWAILIVSREPFVQASRVKRVRALEAANLRVVGEVIETYGAAEVSFNSMRSLRLINSP
jgi:hypothetical protein